MEGGPRWPFPGSNVTPAGRGSTWVLEAPECKREGWGIRDLTAGETGGTVPGRSLPPHVLSPALCLFDVDTIRHWAEERG